MVIQVNLLKYQHLFSCTEQMRNCLQKGNNIESKDFEFIFENYCYVFSKLREDGDFISLIYDMCNEIDVHRTMIVDLFNDTEAFIEFLVIEREIFNKVGISSEVADEFIRLALLFRSRLKNPEDSAYQCSPEDLADDLKRMAEAACSIYSEAQSGNKVANRFYKTLKYGLYLLGATGEVANPVVAVGVTLTGGLVLPAAAVAAGSMVLGKLVKQVASDMDVE